MHGTTFDGQVIAFVDPDPADVWTNTPLNINKAAAQFNSQPDNVWKNFETRLPIVSGVPDFYTNPVSTSDVRFTQAGVLRVVYTGGCVFPSGVTSYQLFNVYQWVDLTFSQPELDISSGASSSIGKVSTTQSVRTNLLKGATVSSAIPVSITPDGATVDTSNLGGANLVVELISQGQNLSDMAASFGVDLGIDEALDTVRQVVRLPEHGVGETLEAVSQFLLSGDKSWNLNPQAFGLTNVQLPSTVMNLFAVPATITTLSDARKLTKLRVMATLPAGTTSCSLYRAAGTPPLSGLPMFHTVITGTSNDYTHYREGFAPSFDAVAIEEPPGSGTYREAIRVRFMPSAVGDVVEVHQLLNWEGEHSTSGVPNYFSWPITNTAFSTANCNLFDYAYTKSDNQGTSTNWYDRGEAGYYSYITTSGTAEVSFIIPDVVGGPPYSVMITIMTYPFNGVTSNLQVAPVRKTARPIPPLIEEVETDSSEDEQEAAIPKKMSRVLPSAEEVDGFCNITPDKVRKATKVPYRTAQ
jgi:hypothetical protein